MPCSYAIGETSTRTSAYETKKHTRSLKIKLVQCRKSNHKANVFTYTVFAGLTSDKREQLPAEEMQKGLVKPLAWLGASTVSLKVQAGADKLLVRRLLVGNDLQFV
jgi:hypothetical protein